MPDNPHFPDPTTATQQQLLRYAKDLSALHVQERQKAEALEQALTALQAERQLLEEKVAERTRELADANAELEYAARLKDEFLANMSHELRTPLNSVLVLAEVILRELQGPLTEAQRNSLRLIHQSGTHLLQLINDILDVSKIGAGALKLEPEMVDVTAVCQSAVSLVKQLAHNKGIRVRTTIAPEATTLVADARRLKQILVNLLSNAVKFTDRGDIGLDVHLADEAIEFSVWDTGIGIAGDDLPRLFRPFVQVEGAINRRYEGTGLGLLLVKRLAMMHDGTVRVESTPDKGSRFTVRLPRRLSPLVGADPPNPISSSDSPTPPSKIPVGPQRLFEAPSGRHSYRVLIADDNGATRDALSTFFMAEGIDVDMAADGITAVHRVRTTPYDLIVMDVQMPRQDGLQATRILKADPTTQHVPILMLTAMAMKGDGDRCLAAGADEYLAKPVNLGRLGQVVQRLLGIPSAASPSPPHPKRDAT